MGVVAGLHVVSIRVSYGFRWHSDKPCPYGLSEFKFHKKDKNEYKIAQTQLRNTRYGVR